MTKILTVVGPTASGKTAAAVELALRFGGEVVSCDSVQIYKGFDIGTAKPGLEERRGVPHHMMDVAGPEEEWSAGRYARAARACVEAVLARGNLPVVAGGSGFYLRALTNGLTGLPPTPDGWTFIYIGLHPERGELERRIQARAAAMLRNGLIEETRTLLNSGVPEACAPMNSIGYVQARAVLRGELPAERAAAEIALRTRQYAKRQRTWFFNQINAHWLEDFSQSGISVVERLLEGSK
ncbi:MAG: tRNA (adenosine(37)-N6)-dimethylallyltransferase MiaA [Oscillospiraceae bacterium]|nr:tRNA (adenosine(37)-N6)-dimethylallyltransferase MiaA [Oscillospiraceae bacterium]